jgi:hypothetical protein
MQTVNELPLEKELLDQAELLTYSFIRENGRWYIDLPEYLAQGGSKSDLEMVAGADDVLDIMADGENKVTLMISTEPFENAELLELVELCDQNIGGGYYIMPVLEGSFMNKRMWLCDVTLFVFGDIPDRIYIRKIQQ